MREIERIRIRNGLCLLCGDVAMPGIRKCAYHRQRNLENIARIQAARAEKGMCSRCDGEALPGRRKCEYHLGYHREMAKARQRDRMAVGLCRSCTRPARPGRKFCKQCLASARRTAHKKRTIAYLRDPALHAALERLLTSAFAEALGSPWGLSLAIHHSILI